MRLWHILFAVMVVALVMAISRNDAGRVAIIVFIGGLGEVVLGTTALMHLFKTIGQFGAARGLLAHLEALMATVVVLVLATASMNAVMWIGIILLQITVP
ncbi:MAG TPA: hypothetical protein VFT74_06230 [Isosphaeraceae bacterium]|nr:hypothetical protein [Isosphaeraceae bacterium]